MKKQNIQGLCTKVTKGVMGILEREERGETFKVTKKKMKENLIWMKVRKLLLHPNLEVSFQKVLENHQQRRSS